MAVQGGLLASVITTREEEDLKTGQKRRHNLWPVLAFLAAKLLVYSLLGFVLGVFGGVLSLSDSARVMMQLLAGVYMVLIAFNLLNVHPIFRYVIIQPPRFLTRMVRNTSKSKELFAPILLGLMTVFIPCGTTLAMEALAISSGNPLSGLLIMSVFILGTSPLFFGLGALTTVLGDSFKSKFFKIAAVLVFYLGVTSVNGALILAGSPVNLTTIAQASPIQIDLSGTPDSNSGSNQSIQLNNGVQNIAIKILPTGYSPNYIKVKAGLPVNLNLTASGGLGCTSIFRIPSLGISKNLYETGSATVTFTPQKVGKLIWTCSMGMYYGTIEVT